MALGPQVENFVLSEKELLEAKELEKEIDEELKTRYSNKKESIAISLEGKKYTPRVAEEVAHRFREAGWKEVKISWGNFLEDSFITFRP